MTAAARVVPETRNAMGSRRMRGLLQRIVGTGVCAWPHAVIDTGVPGNRDRLTTAGGAVGRTSRGAG
jgi:hypothetical protein